MINQMNKHNTILYKVHTQWLMLFLLDIVLKIITMEFKTK